MNLEARSSSRYVFGPFEADHATGELRKSGVRIRLPGQPFQILLVLLENAGEIVSREYLRERIWGQGTFVDFEHGLNAAVNRLRRALGDSAESPRYIQTVTGCGYRFVGTLEPQSVEVPAEPPSSETEELTGPALKNSEPVRKRMTFWIAAGFALVIVLVGSLSVLRAVNHETDAVALGNRRTVVLGSISNTTGHPGLSNTIRSALAAELHKSANLEALPETRVRAALRHMRRLPDTALVPELAREVCERAGSAALMEGAIDALGTQLLVKVRMVNCGTGYVLFEKQSEIEGEERVLPALREQLRDLKSYLRRVQLPSEPTLPELTTVSLEALKSYDAGLKLLFSTGGADALPLFQRAVELDPEFAYAHSHLGRVYADIGETALGVQSITRAYELLDRVSEAENFFITYNYLRSVKRNLELCRRTCESWIRAFPDDVGPHAFLSAFTSQGSGQYERAIYEGRKTIAMAPNHGIAYVNVASALLSLNRLTELEAMLAEAAKRKFDLAELSLFRYFLAFLRNDESAMQRESAERRGKGEGQGWFRYQEALTLGYHGRVRESRNLATQAVDLAKQAGLVERAAGFEGGMAILNALVGNVTEARRTAEAALHIARGRDADYGPAFALALVGRSAEAERLTNELERRHPEDTPVRFKYLPSLRALLALNRKQPHLAVDLLPAGGAYELAATGTSFDFFYGLFYPTYVRGLADLELRRYAEAISAFRVILDHPALVLNDPIGPFVHLQLARALSANGEREKAKEAYGDFFEMWKDADSELPVLLQAKSEFAKLT